MSEVYEKELSISGTSVTITTTTEKAIISSPVVRIPHQTNRILITAWAVLTTGAGTTAVTPTIREGTGITGTVVGEQNAETVKAAAGSNEPFTKQATHDVGDVVSVQ